MFLKCFLPFAQFQPHVSYRPGSYLENVHLFSFDIEATCLQLLVMCMTLLCRCLELNIIMHWLMIKINSRKRGQMLPT